jgi:lipopolysaccharide export system permease protein
MFKFFDRYVLREVGPPFGIGLLLFTFVLLMSQILVLAELFITKGVSFRLAAEVLIDLIPSLLAFAVPMAVLMGILAGLSRLSTDSEIARDQFQAARLADLPFCLHRLARDLLSDHVPCPPCQL